MAGDVWPDGTPNRTFNRAAWDGAARLVEPTNANYGLGDIVALREPVDGDGKPTIEGVVLWVSEPDENGELVATIARRIRRDRDTPNMRFEWRVERHSTSSFDPAWHIATSVFKRGHVWRVAGEIAEGVGRRYARSKGAQWSRDDKLLLGAALQLADVGLNDEFTREETRT